MKSLKLSPARISRSLVTIMVLTLTQVIGTPIFNVNTPSANAVGDPALIQTDLMFAGIGSDFNGNGVSLVGTPSYTAGPPAYYTFDSDAKYAYKNIDYPNNHAASIFMWVYPTAAGIILNLNATSAQDSGHRTSMIDYTGSKFRFGLYDGVTGTVSVEANVATPPNNWYFIGFTYSGGAGGTLTSYVNGAATGSVVVTNGWDTPSDVAGGNYFHFGSQSTNGAVVGAGTPSASTVIRSGGRYRLNEAAFYNSSQSSADVLANYNATRERFAPIASALSNSNIYTNRSATYSTTCSRVLSANGSGVCAYQWQQSGDSGATWSDISGATSSSYTTPIQSSASSNQQFRVKVIDSGAGSPGSPLLYSISSAAALTVTAQTDSTTDNSLSLVGSTTAKQYAFTDTSSVINISNAFSLEAWVKPETSTASFWNMVICKEGAIQFGFQEIGGIPYWSYGLSSSTGTQYSALSTGVPVSSGEWHHIALTRVANQNSVDFYLDGEKAFTGTADQAGTGEILNTNAYPFSIGARRISSSSASGFFGGQIDQVRIFNTARSGAEVKSDLSSYSTINSSGLIAYYDFNEGSGLAVFNRATNANGASDLTITGGATFKSVAEVSTTALTNYTIAKFTRSIFTSSGGWKSPANVSKASVLVVGGGGGGGSRHAGGGGAGGIGYGATYTLSPETFYNLQIGVGGRGYGQPGNNSYNVGSTTTIYKDGPGGGVGTVGGNSFIKLASSTVESITAIGGGGGSGGTTSGAGGSGGGSNQTNMAGGLSTQYSASGWVGYGNAGGVGVGNTTCSSAWCGGGGGGAGGVGRPGNESATATGPGSGGVGRSFDISGTATFYAGGGGGGGYDGTSTAAGGTGGGGAGGKNTEGSSGTYATGGGGGGGGFNNGARDFRGGNGGSGIIIIRWITALVPSYTKPTTAYLNVGMTETFTTNVAVDSATVNLIRTFKWESTTPSANGTYTLIKQGTGAANAAFSWIPSDTSTSGSGYLYRLTVTDSDTAGLFITDSSTAYAVINRALSVSGNATFGKTISLSKTESFTISLGTPTYRASLTRNNSGITLDTSTAGVAAIGVSETMTVGTYYETLTVTDSVSASVITPLTIVVVAPPNLLNTGEISTDGLQLNYDIGNSASLIGESGTATTGLTLYDLSGRKRNASTNVNPDAVNNTSGCVAPRFTSENGGALDFSGDAKSCYYVSGYNGTNLSGSYTVEAWFKVTKTLSGYAAVLSQSYKSTNPISITIGSLNDGLMHVAFWNGGWRYEGTGFTPVLGKWTHIAGTYNASRMTTYIDGAFYDDVAWTEGLFTITNTRGLLIGNGHLGDGGFPGLVGAVRIYNRCFTAAEIAANYNATKYRFQSDNSNLITPTKKYGTVANETFTATAGYGADTISYSTGSKYGVVWTTLGAATTLKLQESLTATTHYDTITVTDSLGASTYLPIKMTVSKADTLTISMDTATTVVYNASPITVYPKVYFKGLAGVDTLTASTRFTSSTYTDSATVPTDVDTYTVIAANPVFSVGALSNYVNVIYETSTAKVTQANQNKLSINLYGAVAGSSFLIQTFGGSGDGPVTESVTAGSTATGCAVSNHVLSNTSPSTQQLTCNILVTKAASKNYKVETLTATVYFMLYANNMPTNQVGSGSTIGLNGINQVWVDPGAAPTITGPGAGTYSNNGTATIVITGSGFSLGPVIVKFERNQVGTISPGATDTSMTVTIPSGARTGVFSVTNKNGTEFSSFVITIG